MSVSRRAQSAFLKRARQELAKVLSGKKPPDYREAYQNASKALKLEKNLEGPDIDKLHRTAVEIADKILGVQTPPY